MLLDVTFSLQIRYLSLYSQVWWINLRTTKSTCQRVSVKSFAHAPTLSKRSRGKKKLTLQLRTNITTLRSILQKIDVASHVTRHNLLKTILLQQRCLLNLARNVAPCVCAFKTFTLPILMDFAKCPNYSEYSILV